MKTISALLLALIWTDYDQNACKKNLLIDNYANSVPDDVSPTYTYDDATTVNFTKVAADRLVSFYTDDAESYVFTDFSCKKLKSEGYVALNLPLKAPKNGASVTIELQTSSSCSTTKYSSFFTSLTIAAEGIQMPYSIPLSAFKGANLDAVQAFVFQDFTPGYWEIGETSFVCADNTDTNADTKADTMTPAITPYASQSVSSLAQIIVGRDCTPYLIDDFISQSRLTFLFYNARLLPSSDDGTMKPVSGRPDTQTSVIVANNHVTFEPANRNSYWFTQLGCFKATNQWGGIGLTIKAETGTSLRVELGSDVTCSSTNPKNVALFAQDLDWTFDGTERYYQIPFSKFPGLDTDHLVSLLFSGLDRAITLGPIALYCGNTGTAYPIPATPEPAEPISNIPPTTGSSDMVIDAFTNKDSNALGFYHGGDDENSFKIANSKLTINTQGNADQSWYTQVANGCTDLTSQQNGYLHLAYSGSNAFTISLQQHNPTCNDKIQPTPYTWDSVEAARYSNSINTDIYVPLTHFSIDRSKSIAFALKGFYTSNPTMVSRIEIVKNVPKGFLIPSKLPTAPLIFSCTRPNSFAFAIDDGEPKYAQRVVSAIAQAGIKVTFFTVGAALRDSSTNLTGVYKGMLEAGHQVAYHSFTHPPMEGLPSLSAIDWEFEQDVQAVKDTLGVTSTYFRPPFGTEGARVRQRLESLVPGSKFVMWSVDVQDYLWANSPTPENQITNFQRDVDKGGNLVVMHYLYDSTVSYLPKFIEIAKATGKQLMRVDQCLEDPAAPPL